MRCDTADGRVNGREYHGLVYFATDDNGNTIATPLKASRLGKFASRTAIDGRFERAKEKIDVAPTKRKVADVLGQSSGKDDFVAKLKERNIDVVFRYTDEGRIYGVTFVDHDTMTALNGSRLGKEFSADALNARFSQQQQPTEQAPTAKVVPIPTPTNTTSESQSTSSAGTAPTPTQSQSAHSDSGDYDFTLPGLDLFQPGQSFNPDEEEFRRRMQKKKKGIRRRF